MFNLSPVDHSEKALLPQEKISESNRIILVALEALARCESSSPEPSEFNPQCLLSYDSTLTEEQELLVLKIIFLGLKKYDFSPILNKPSDGVSACKKALEQRVQEVLLKQKTKNSFSWDLTRFISSLDASGIEALNRIKHESRGLHITPELVVGQYIESSEEEIPRLTQMVHTLVRLRTSKQLLLRSDKEARQNLNECSKALKQYLRDQVRDISLDEIQRVNPEIPELLEILWEVIRLGEECQRNLIEKISRRARGEKITFPGLLHLRALQEFKEEILRKPFFTEGCSFAELNEFKRIAQSRVTGLRIWLDENQSAMQRPQGLRFSEEKLLNLLFDENAEEDSKEMTEVLESLEYYERCLRLFDLKRIENYGFPIPNWE